MHPSRFGSNTMNLFDYLFYRVTAFYKRRGNSSAVSFASSAVTVLQCFLIIDLLVLIRCLYEYSIPNNFNKFWALPFILILGATNWYRYERSPRYQELRKTWKDEDLSQKRKRGRLIVLFIIAMLIIPVLYGLIRHNMIGGKSFFG